MKPKHSATTSTTSLTKLSKRTIVKLVRAEVSKPTPWCFFKKFYCSVCQFDTGENYPCDFVRIRKDLGYRSPEDYDTSILELAMCIENSDF